MQYSLPLDHSGVVGCYRTSRCTQSGSYIKNHTSRPLTSSAGKVSGVQVRPYRVESASSGGSAMSAIELSDTRRHPRQVKRLNDEISHKAGRNEKACKKEATLPPSVRV